MKSRAAVLFEAKRPLEIVDLDVAAPRDGEVLVQMAAAGVCHSDLHVMRGELIAPLPAVLGHEGSGIVAEVGKSVSTLAVGDHVIPLWRLSCGVCEFCVRRRPALCLAGTAVRNTGLLPDGTTPFSMNARPITYYAGVSTFSAYSVIPEAALLKIPKTVPLQQACLLGCAVITGYGAVIHAAKVQPGDAVAVFGVGGVGLNVIQSAVMAGARVVVAIDRVFAKLATARGFGATHVIDATANDPVAAIQEITARRGVDVAFDVVGDPVVTRAAYDSLARLGKLVVVGIAPTGRETPIPMTSLMYEERTIVGCLYGSGAAREDIPALIGLYDEGKLKLDELLTCTYPLDEINEAFAALQRGDVARCVIRF